MSEPMPTRGEGVAEILAHLAKIEARWNPAHLEPETTSYPSYRDVAWLCAQLRAALAAPGDAGAKGFCIAGEPVSDAVGEEFGRLIAERDKLQQQVTAANLLAEQTGDADREAVRRACEKLYGGPVNDAIVASTLDMYRKVCAELPRPAVGEATDEPDFVPDGHVRVRLQPADFSHVATPCPACEDDGEPCVLCKPPHRAEEASDIEALILAERDAHKGNPDFNDGYQLGIDRAAVVARRTSRAGEATEAVTVSPFYKPTPEERGALAQAAIDMMADVKRVVTRHLGPRLASGNGILASELSRDLVQVAVPFVKQALSPAPAGAETAEEQS